MKISSLEIENGKQEPIRIAIGAETKEGLEGIFYLDNIHDSFSLIESLNFPLDYVYSLNGNGKRGLFCRMKLSEGAKRLLSQIYPNDLIKKDSELPDLISKTSKEILPEISITLDFKTGSYEVKPTRICNNL